MRILQSDWLEQISASGLDSGQVFPDRIKFIDRQRFIDDSGDSSSSLPSREAIEVVVGSYSSVLNLGEKEASSFLFSVVKFLNERSKSKMYLIDAEFNVYKNDARGRNPATDFAIVVCIYYIIWWYILYCPYCSSRVGLACNYAYLCSMPVGVPHADDFCSIAQV